MKRKKRSLKLNSFNINDRRINFILIFTIIFFCIIVFRIFYLNVFMSNYYNMMLDKNTSNYVYSESVPRGRILDRNGKIIVDNKAVKTIYYKKPNGITVDEEIELAYRIGKLLKLDYENVTDRNLREFYNDMHPDITNKLITK